MYRNRTPPVQVCVLAPVRGWPVECRFEPCADAGNAREPGRCTSNGRELEVIPDSFVVIAIVLAIPVVGLLAALVASRIPSRRSDS